MEADRLIIAAIFTLDRLIDAAANIGITVRMTATRPYRNG
jgi:hypothetical protein